MKSNIIRYNKPIGIKINTRTSVLGTNDRIKYRIKAIDTEENNTLKISLIKKVGLRYFLTKNKFKIKSKAIEIKYPTERPMAEK